MKRVRVKLSPEAEKVYLYLNKEAPTSKTERMILKGVNQKKDLIKGNPHYGEPIAKNLIENCAGLKPRTLVRNFQSQKLAIRREPVKPRALACG